MPNRFNPGIMIAINIKNSNKNIFFVTFGFDLLRTRQLDIMQKDLNIAYISNILIRNIIGAHFWDKIVPMRVSVSAIPIPVRGNNIKKFKCIVFRNIIFSSKLSLAFENIGNIVPAIE